MSVKSRNILKKGLEDKRGIKRTGFKVNVISHELCKKIRERLKIKSTALTDETIVRVITLSLKETQNWIIENKEGFKLHKNMGYIAITKLFPKEMKEDKEEIIQRLQSYPISPIKKAKMIAEYMVEPGEGKYPLNLDQFLYYYNTTWFNKRNCSIRKALVYKYMPSRNIKKEINKRVKDGFEYYEWTYDDWYNWKIKAK